MNRLLAEVGERGKVKGERFGIFLSPVGELVEPLTFSLFPQECKSVFCKRSNEESLHL